MTAQGLHAPSLSRHVHPLLAALVIAACSLGSPATAGTDGGTFRLDVTKHVLGNGMRVLVVPRRDAPVVATHLRFAVGGVDDPKGQTGIAHLLEHMMFKGTETLGVTDQAAEAPLLAKLDELWTELDMERAKAGTPFGKPDDAKISRLEDEIARTTAEHSKHVVKNELWQVYERSGGTGLNASTGNDSTQYYVQLPSNQLEIWARLEADRIRNPVFREFYSERDVVHEERRLRTDTQPRGLFQEAFQALAYSAHPYRQPVVGWSADIDATVRAEVLQYFKTYYAPNNAIAVLVGDLEPKATIALMEKHFGSIPAQPPPRRTVTEEPKQLGERRLTMTLDAAPALTIGWHAPAAGHRDAAALGVAARVLSSGGFFGGGTGRLQKRLVHGQKVALNANGWFRPSLYPGLFTISATPALDRSLEELEKSVLAEITNLALEPPTDDELARVRNALDAQAVRRLSSNSGIASALAQAEAISGDWHWLETEREQLKAVTAEDVRRVVDAYLTAENRTVGVLAGTRRPGARPTRERTGQ